MVDSMNDRGRDRQAGLERRTKRSKREGGDADISPNHVTGSHDANETKRRDEMESCNKFIVEQ